MPALNRIIGTKRYNTATATPIHRVVRNADSQGGQWSETLFRKRTGEFFLVLTGDWASPYAQPKITPLTEREARTWCRAGGYDPRHLPAASLSGDSDSERLNLTLSAEDLAQVKRHAQAQGVSPQEIIRGAVREWLELA